MRLEIASSPIPSRTQRLSLLLHLVAIDALLASNYDTAASLRRSRLMEGTLATKPALLHTFQPVVLADGDGLRVIHLVNSYVAVVLIHAEKLVGSIVPRWRLGYEGRWLRH